MNGQRTYIRSPTATVNPMRAPLALRSQPLPANLARGVMRPQRPIQIAKASSTKPHASTLHPCYAPARSHLSAPPQLLSRAAASAISPGKPAYAQVAAHQQRQQPTAPTSQFYRLRGVTRTRDSPLVLDGLHPAAQNKRNLNCD